MVFSQTRSCAGAHVLAVCWMKCHAATELAGSQTSRELDVCSLFESSMFSSLRMVFQSRTEMQWDRVGDGIVCLGNVLLWWWGGRKGHVSVPFGCMVTRADWLLRSWCHEETCPVSSFWPSERQGDKAAEPITCQQQHSLWWRPPGLSRGCGTAVPDRSHTSYSYLHPWLAFWP